MDPFRTPDKLKEFYTEWSQSASLTRQQLARNIGVGQCYYIGVQWIQQGIPLPNLRAGDGTGRLRTDINPDSNKLRTTVNRVSKYVIKEAAATHPEKFEVECLPLQTDTGVEAAHRASVIERLAGMSVDACGLLAQAQDANFDRCIGGCWGIGFYMQDRTITIDGERMVDQAVKAFTFNPSCLVLDPYVKSRNLGEHETVVYEDVWTADKIERVFKVKLDRDEMQTVGQLTTVEQQINVLSQNQLYIHYRTHSKTKGAKVAQVHTKTPDGRFGIMYLMYQASDGEWQCPNFAEPVSPWGGNGLPLGLLHGHRRPGASWSIGAAAMLKDDQDRLNLLGSLMFRQLQKNSGFFWKVDKRNFPTSTTEEAIASKFTNQVGGVLVYESRSERGVAPPELQQYPAPQPFLMDSLEKFENDMRQQVSRAEGHFGLGAKSHVPYQTTERLLEEADQVLGIRVREDTKTYVDLVKVATGTVLKMMRDESPGTLAIMRAKGFAPDDFAVLLNVDPDDLPCETTIREASVRYRSLSSKRMDLSESLVNKAITPMQYRMEQAVLDTPLTASDRQMYSELQRAVTRLVLGEQWSPLPLGEYNEMALGLLRRALFDPRVRTDQQARQRVMEAIIAQTMAMAEEQTLATPQPDQTPQQGAVPEEPVSATLGEVLSGSGASAAPTAAA